MSEYVNTYILECNRQNSDQFDNEEETALWNNNVNNGLKLDIGDKISIQGAFVSDLGAENSTIEFKGKQIQDTQTFNITDIGNLKEIHWEGQDNFADETNPRYYLQSDITNRDVTISDIKDNDANVVVHYYKTNNGEYHFQMPIFFSPPYDFSNIDKQYTWSLLRDNTAYTSGAALVPAVHHRFAGDWQAFDSVDDHTQMLLDNSRFAIFGRETTPFIQLDGLGPGAVPKKSQINNRDLFAYGTKYLKIKDLIRMNVNEGFNTPTEISNLINEQMTKQTPIEQTTYNYVNNLQGDSINKRPIGPENETPTNKLFNCATSEALNSANAEFFYGMADGTIPPKQNPYIFNYISNFQFIGIKRPEIYETGIKLHDATDRTDIGNNWPLQEPAMTNTYDPPDDQTSVNCVNPYFTDWITENPFGDWNVNDIEFKYTVINTNYKWTRENLEMFQNFFKAQARYPELFDMNIDNNRLVYNKKVYLETEYNGEDITVDTHRYLHLQSRLNSVIPKEMIVNDEQAIGVPAVPQFDIGTTSFGYDNIPGYFSLQGAKEGTVNTNQQDFSSVPLFVKYYKDYENDTRFNDDSPADYWPYDYTHLDGKGLWGGFALRTPESLTATDAGIPYNFEKLYNIPQKWEHTQDTISFIAQVPKYAGYMEKYPLYTSVGGGAPTQRDIWSMYDIDWYRDLNVLGGNNVTSKTRRIGFDPHPSAYGNNYIGLYNGVCGPEGHSFDNEWTVSVPEGKNPDWLDPTSAKMVRTPNPEYISDWLNKLYVGASAPQLSFDTTSSRFSFTDLHTPEIITPDYDATLTKGHNSGSVIPIPENVGKSVYKINKVFDMSNFSPSVCPYFKPFPVHIEGTSHGDFPLPYANPYCKTGKPFDMTSGICLEQFNIEKKNWKKCFWNICGFSYEDLNLENASGGLQERIVNGETNDINVITTNAEIVNTDLDEWSGGAVGVPTYKNFLTTPHIINLQNAGAGHPTASFQDAPVTVLCQSAAIEATNLPTKTLRPYFTIRSDILDDSYFSGGNKQFSSLPVIAILQKNQQYGDFFYGEDAIEFTVTKPKTITSITTVITDPSGELSNLSPNSSVIYKVQKAKVQQNILQEVLQSSKKH